MNREPSPDAETRVRELRAAISALWGERDDPMVQSELVVLLGDLRRVERVEQEAAA